MMQIISFLQKVRFVHVAVLILCIYIPVWIGTVLSSNDTLNFAVSAGADAGEYVLLSEHMNNLGVYSLSSESPFIPETFRTPGYPLFMSVVLFIFHSYFVVTLVQVAAVIGTAYFICKLTHKVTDSSIASSLAAVLFAVNPSVIFHTMVIGPDIIFTFMLVLAIYCTLYSRDSILFSFISGALFGVVTLVRPLGEFAFLLVVGFYVATRYLHVPRKTIFMHCLVMSIGFIVVLSPWIIRNGIVAGKYSISSISAYNLFHYNIPEFMSITFGTPIDEVRMKMREEINLASSDLGRELKNSDALMGVSTKILTEHFVSYSIFHSVKTIPFFFTSGIKTIQMTLHHVYPQVIDNVSSVNISTPLYKKDIVGVLKAFSSNWVVMVEYIVWALLCVLSLLACIIKRHQIVVFSALCILLFAGLTGPVSYSRYRIPIEPFLWILSVTAIHEIIKRKKQYEIIASDTKGR